METRMKVIVVTIVFGILGFALEANGPLGGMIWPPMGDIKPTGAQLPLFMILGVMEAVVFGLGFAFLFFGYPLLRRAGPGVGEGRALAAYVAIAWSLISWVPHDSLHQHVGMNLNGLLALEYGFHVTLMIAGLLVARFFIAALKGAGDAKRVTPAAAVAAVAGPPAK